jgi:hypothetical protein
VGYREQKARFGGRPRFPGGGGIARCGRSGRAGLRSFEPADVTDSGREQLRAIGFTI